VLSLKLTYKKLWKLMIDREINRKTLAKMANISASTLTKLSKGDCVNTDMLVRICIALKCDLHDIVELVPDETDELNIEGLES
jgi:DNA-binding Xre family transcriptional regulator